MLLAVATTAALAALATGLAATVLAFHEQVAFRERRLQTRVLARDVLRVAHEAFDSGRVDLPAIAERRVWINGAAAGAAPLFDAGAALPGTRWTNAPDPAWRQSDGGAGTRVEVTAPTPGPWRAASGRRLLDVRVDAWYRGARVRELATLEVSPDGVRRLQ